MKPEVRFLPEGKSVQVRPGTSLLDASRVARANVRTRCGGLAACLMCKVNVRDQSGISSPGHNEQLKLGSLLEEGYRLACQAKVHGDVTVHVPEDPLKAAIRKQLELKNDDDWW